MTGRAGKADQGGERSWSGETLKRRVRRATELISQVVQNARNVITMGRHPTVSLKVQRTAQQVANTFRSGKTLP